MLSLQPPARPEIAPCTSDDDLVLMVTEWWNKTVSDEYNMVRRAKGRTAQKQPQTARADECVA
jgi:hypothetical protein